MLFRLLLSISGFCSSPTRRLMSSGVRASVRLAVLTASPASAFVRSAEYIRPSSGEENSPASGRLTVDASSGSRYSSLTSPSSAAAEAGSSYPGALPPDLDYWQLEQRAAALFELFRCDTIGPADSERRARIVRIVPGE